MTGLSALSVATGRIAAAKTADYRMVGPPRMAPCVMLRNASQEAAMTRTIRNRVAIVIFAFFLVSFVLHLWLFYYCFAVDPELPHPERGFIYPLNNHGAYAYVTAIEATELSLLFNGCFVAFISLLVVVPKDYIWRSTTSPKWLPSLGFQFHTDLEKPSAELVILAMAGAAAWCAIILLAGPVLARWLVAWGVILPAA